MWDVGQTVYAHSQWEHLFGDAFENLQPDFQTSKAIGNASAVQLGPPTISPIRSISLARSTSPACLLMTNSLVTAAPRSERSVGQHEAPSGVRTVGRVGIASRGVIYLLLAYLTFDIARHGSAPTQTSSTGALQELEARSGGKSLLVVLAIGLGCYAAWRLFDVVTGANGAIRRLSSLAVGIIYGVLCVRAVELVAGYSASGGASSNPVPWVAKIMGWSGGTVMIEVAGAAFVAAGVGLAAWGLLHRYDKNLALERVSRPCQRAIRILGGFGDLARGSLIALFGVYLIDAGVKSDPAQAKSVDQTLRALVYHRFGALAIGVIALGLLAFGVFSFFDARLRRL